MSSAWNTLQNHHLLHRQLYFTFFVLNIVILSLISEFHNHWYTERLSTALKWGLASGSAVLTGACGSHSMEHAGSWTVSGSKEVMEVPNNFKDLQKLCSRNISRYSAANVPLPAFFSSADIHFFHTIRHVYKSVWPAREAKPRYGATLERSAHACETRLLQSKTCSS